MNEAINQRKTINICINVITTVGGEGRSFSFSFLMTCRKVILKLKWYIKHKATKLKHNDHQNNDDPNF